MSKYGKNRRARALKPAPGPRWKRADKLPGLTRPQSKLMNYLVNGWRLVVSRHGVKRVRGSKQKVDFRDFLALVKRGFLTALGALTLAGKALCDHFGTPMPVAPKPTPPAPVRSDTEWNAFPPSASGKPAPYMALTSEGHLVIQQKRVVAAGNSLSDSEKLRLAAANIGGRTAVTA